MITPPDEKAVARITYGRPQKNNRPVFGKMVPYGKIWRTGANEATEFIAYQPLTFGSKTLPAGTYTLFTIPEKDEWTLIFNTDVDIWGAYRYDSKKDVLRLNVKVNPRLRLLRRLPSSLQHSMKMRLY